MEGRDIPIVHRVIKSHTRWPEVAAGGDGRPPAHVLPHQDVLTKGDNNYGDDKARPRMMDEMLSPSLLTTCLLGLCF